MTELASKQIHKELAAMLNDPPPGCTLLQMGDDIYRLDLGTYKVAIALVLCVSYCELILYASTVFVA